MVCLNIESLNGACLNRIRRFIPLILLCAILFNSLPTAAQNATPTRANTYTYGDCAKLDKQQLRSEIERYAKETLDTPLKPIDIDTMVSRKWAELSVDATIDGEVARAVEQVRQDEGYWSRLWSGWSPDQADQFARRIISDTFNSPVFSAKLNELSTAIGNEIARNVQAEFSRAASSAFLCLQQYVGERYSVTLFSAFEEDVRLKANTIDLSQAAKVDVNAVDVHGKALTGVGLIVVTEIARRVAVKLSEKIAERVAGKIIGRVLGKAGTSLIPVAGWVIGIGLIVWDLWEGGQGALPQIQESLTSEDVKVKIRSEIATVIKDGLPQESAIAAVEISATLIDEWDRFCTDNRYLCLVADENPGMRSLLDYVPVGDLSKLSSWVETMLSTVGRDELDAAIDNSQLEKALALPVQSTTILSETRSLAETLAWADVAGDRLPVVVQEKLYLKKSALDFDASSLALLLDVKDSESIAKITSLDVADMQAFLQLPAESVMALAHAYSFTDLQNLVAVLRQPQATPVAVLADQVVKGETTIEQLQTLSDTHQLSTSVSSIPPSADGAAVVTSYVNPIIVFFTTLYSSTLLFVSQLSWLQITGIGAVVLGMAAVILALLMSRRD